MPSTTLVAKQRAPSELTLCKAWQTQGSVLESPEPALAILRLQKPRTCAQCQPTAADPQWEQHMDPHPSTARLEAGHSCSATAGAAQLTLLSAGKDLHFSQHPEKETSL